MHEGDEITEEAAIAQRMLRDVADEAELEIALPELAQKLDAAEQQHVVDGGDQPRPLRQAVILLRHDHQPVAGAYSREAFVEPALALRQADDRLQRQLDPFLLQPPAQDIEQRAPRQPAGDRRDRKRKSLNST